jgi:hypothetical protein
MTEKNSFFGDWSALTDEQVVSNIKYLLEHYKEYDIYSQYGSSHVIVGDVDISRFETLHNNVYCYSINNKWYGEMADKSILALLQNLMNVCYEESVVQEAQRSKKGKRNTIIAIASWLIIMSVLAGIVFKIKYKEIVINNKVKQYEKTLSDCKDWEQKQQKIASYRDSLRNAKIK